MPGGGSRINGSLIKDILTVCVYLYTHLHVRGSRPKEGLKGADSFEEHVLVNAPQTLLVSTSHVPFLSLGLFLPPQPSSLTSTLAKVLNNQPRAVELLH